MSTLTSSATELPDLAGASHASIAIAQPRRGLIAMYAQLTKARLSAMVLLTTAVGFALGSAQGVAIDWARLGWTILGTALCAGCASALNQLCEISRDARMRRTENRPLPSGSMSAIHAFIASIVMGYAGLSMLALKANLLASGLALATILIYVLAYTPLKIRSTINTLVGAICGALPPMIGWVAAADQLNVGAWLLGAILFVWQIPHFFALAWLYRHDYERGGFIMLPVLDRDGRLTTQVIVLTTLLLIPLALLSTLLGVSGVYAAVGSLPLGLWMLMLSVRLHQKRSDANARGMFLATLAYLPLVLCLMVMDRGPIN